MLHDLLLALAAASDPATLLVAPSAALSPALGAGPAPIIGGEEARLDEYPMAGAVIMEMSIKMNSGVTVSARMRQCSSTLIAPDVVMLAAHCVDTASWSQYGEVQKLELRWSRTVDLSGYTAMGMPPWPADGVAVAEWVLHPDWPPAGGGGGLGRWADIALLFLEAPVLDVVHGYLPTAEEGARLEEGMPVDIVGWGVRLPAVEMTSQNSGIKHKAVSHIAELGEWELEVGAVFADPHKCDGDSGGPSFARPPTESPEPMRVVGVTSHAYDAAASDCSNRGGIDTRVDAYLDWIDTEMRTRCEAGTRAWCEVAGIVPPPASAPAPEPEPPAPEEPRGEGGFEEAEGACALSPARPVRAVWLGALALSLGLGLARRRQASLMQL
jgi:hypothetical protein